jgi:UDP-2,4-diacetamido-2,4,6-trideoxy-beta-L-altropyranose hydrolase
MRVAFRADASLAVGSGHVMRCLTLADDLKRQGAETLFISREIPGNLGDLVAARGHGLAWLPARGTPEADAADTAAILDGNAWEWLVVDHYDLDATWERAQRHLARNILVIDDLADRPHDCDLLLDQNVQQPDRYQGLLPVACRTLLGPRFALLRPQFAEARGQLKPRDGRVRRLLVFCGGSDAAGDTLKVLAGIRESGRNDLGVDVVIGQANPHAVPIEATCRTMPGAVLHRQVADMAAIMAAADLYLGAGGTSSWERCCLGLPALVLATAGNQIEQARSLAETGAQLYLGPSAEVDAVRLGRMLSCVCDSPLLLAHIARQAQELVDGHGAGRVAARMLAAEISLRPAGLKDSDALFTWRNHPDTRRHAFDSAEIEREGHENWLAAVLADEDRELLIAEHNQQPVGVLRYDIEAGRALVSVYLVPGMAGQGLGVRLLLAGEGWIEEKRQDVRFFEAEIGAANEASIHAFLAAGYSPQRATYRKDRNEHS